MFMKEAAPDDALLEKLIALSGDWEAEDSCWGYRANERSDIEGCRVFLAEDGGEIVGYLLGRNCRSERRSSVLPEGSPYFEVEELYVIPARRSEGVGTALFTFAENAVRPEADCILLSTATKNWRAVFHFYLDQLDMQFWSARLFKRLR